MKFWPTKDFQRGIASSIAVFAVFCGVAGYLMSLIWDLKDEQLATYDQGISDLKTQFENMKSFEEKYHAEHGQRLTVETELSQVTARAKELDTKLSALLDEKWREKYEAEHLRAVTLEEELTLIEKRYMAQIEVLDTRLEAVETPDMAALISSNAQLEKDNEVLGERLRLVNSELSQLREIHVESQVTGSPSKKANALAGQNVGANEIVVKRGQGWTSPDGVATFGVERIGFSRAFRGSSSTYHASVKVFGESQNAQAGSSYSKEIDGSAHRITVTGISTTEQTVTIKYIAPE